MAYTKTNWQTGDTITAEKLNNIESGVKRSVDGAVAPIQVDPYKTDGSEYNWDYWIVRDHNIGAGLTAQDLLDAIVVFNVPAVNDLPLRMIHRKFNYVEPFTQGTAEGLYCSIPMNDDANAVLDNMIYFSTTGNIYTQNEPIPELEYTGGANTE